jgi:hypothetical protein
LKAIILQQKSTAALQPQRCEADASPRTIAHRRTIPPALPRLVPDLNIDFATSVEPTISMKIQEDLTRAIVLIKDGIRVLGSVVAASRCVLELPPVGANDADGTVFAVPVLGEVVQREGLVGVNNIIGSTGGVFGGCGRGVGCGCSLARGQSSVANTSNQIFLLSRWWWSSRCNTT